MVLPTPLQAFSGMPKASANTEKQTIVDGEKMTGAEALVRSLEDLGVQDVFGIPGGAILPVYHAIKDDTKFRFVLMRHEQAAGHAAEGYAVATGRVGVCIVTSGPGATNMITPIADANMDSIPLVVITGQVGVNAIGTDAFQEADIVGATYPVVKHSYLVTRAQDIPRVLAEAHYIARSGRPGPVVVDITKTAQTGDMYYSWPQRMILPGYNPTTKAHGRVLSDAAKLFEQSYRPVLYVGGGAVRSDLFLHPDPTTLVALPWRPEIGSVVRMFCQVTYPDGTPLPSDSRAILKKAVAEAEAKGYSFAFGSEMEFYLFQTDEHGNPTKEPYDRAGYMDIAPADKGENVRREVCLMLEQMGIQDGDIVSMYDLEFEYQR